MSKPTVASLAEQVEALTKTINAQSKIIADHHDRLNGIEEDLVTLFEDAPDVPEDIVPEDAPDVPEDIVPEDAPTATPAEIAQTVTRIGTEVLGDWMGLIKNLRMEGGLATWHMADGRITCTLHGITGGPGGDMILALRNWCAAARRHLQQAPAPQPEAEGASAPAPAA